MARIARVVAPGLPHHITQRGNRRQQTFFTDDDYQQYVALLSSSCQRSGVEIWAYCLMPNHVHLIAVPQEPDSLRAAIGEAHRERTGRPLGSEAFIEKIQTVLNRVLCKQKPGPKKAKNNT